MLTNTFKLYIPTDIAQLLIAGVIEARRRLYPESTVPGLRIEVTLPHPDRFLRWMHYVAALGTMRRLHYSARYFLHRTRHLWITQDVLADLLVSVIVIGSEYSPFLAPAAANMRATLLGSPDELPTLAQLFATEEKLETLLGDDYPKITITDTPAGGEEVAHGV